VSTALTWVQAPEATAPVLDEALEDPQAPSRRDPPKMTPTAMTVGPDRWVMV
jgi:hypothetical protein